MHQVSLAMSYVLVAICGLACLVASVNSYRTARYLGQRGWARAWLVGSTFGAIVLALYVALFLLVLVGVPVPRI